MGRANKHYVGFQFINWTRRISAQQQAQLTCNLKQQRPLLVELSAFGRSTRGLIVIWDERQFIDTLAKHAVNELGRSKILVELRRGRIGRCVCQQINSPLDPL